MTYFSICSSIDSGPFRVWFQMSFVLLSHVFKEMCGDPSYTLRGRVQTFVQIGYTNWWSCQAQPTSFSKLVHDFTEACNSIFLTFMYLFFLNVIIEMYPPLYCNLIVDTYIGGEILSCIYELLTQMCRLILYCAVLYLGRTFRYLVYMLKKHLLRRSEKKTIYLTGPLMLTGNCNRNCNRISILVGVQWIRMTVYY